MPRTVFEYGFVWTFTDKGVVKGMQAGNRAMKGSNKTMKETNKSARQAAGGLRALAGAYNALIVARKAAAAMTAVIKPAVDLEHEMGRMRAATGLGADSLERLRRASFDAAKVTPFTPTEAVSAATKLNLALRDVEGSAATLIPTLSMAHVFMEGNVAKSTQLASQIIGGFNLRTREAAEALDYLVAMQRGTGIQVSEMAEGMKKLGLVTTVAGQTGIKGFKDLLPLFALSVRGFRSSSSAATGWLTGMLRMSDPRIYSRLEERLGVVIHTGERLRPISDIMMDLARAAEGNEQTWRGFMHEIDKAFGKRAGKPWISLMQQLMAGIPTDEGKIVRMGDALAYLQDKGMKSPGLLKGVTTEFMMTTENQFTLLRDALMKLAMTVSQDVVPPLALMINTITDLVNKLQSLFSGTSTTAMIMRKLAGGIIVLAGTWVMATGLAMAFKASQVAIGLAMQFLRGSTASSTVAIATQAHVMRGAAVSTRAWAGAMTLATRMAYGLTAAVRVLARSTGPLIIAFVAVEALMYAMESIWGRFGQGGMDADINRMMADAKRGNSDFLKVLGGFGGASKDLARTASSLDEAVDRWVKTMKQKAPMLSHKALDLMGAKLEAAISLGKEGGGITKTALARQQFGVIKSVFEARGRVDRDTLKKAQLAFALLSQGLKMTTNESKTFKAALDSIGKGLNNFHKNSSVTAAAGHALGIQTEKYNAMLDKKLAAEKKQLGQAADVETGRDRVVIRTAKARLKSLAREISDARDSIQHAEMKAALEARAARRKWYGSYGPDKHRTHLGPQVWGRTGSAPAKWHSRKKLAKAYAISAKPYEWGSKDVADPGTSQSLARRFMADIGEGVLGWPSAEAYEGKELKSNLARLTKAPVAELQRLLSHQRNLQEQITKSTARMKNTRARVMQPATNLTEEKKLVNSLSRIGVTGTGVDLSPLHGVIKKATMTKRERAAAESDDPAVHALTAMNNRGADDSKVLKSMEGHLRKMSNSPAVSGKTTESGGPDAPPEGGGGLWLLNMFK